jgi:hypothetical protein
LRLPVKGGRQGGSAGLTHSLVMGILDVPAVTMIWRALRNGWCRRVSATPLYTGKITQWTIKKFEDGITDFRMEI